MKESLVRQWHRRVEETINMVVNTICECSPAKLGVPVERVDSGIFGASIATGAFFGAYHHLVYYENYAALSVEEVGGQEEAGSSAAKPIHGASTSQITVPTNSQSTIIPPSGPPSGSQRPFSLPVGSTGVVDLTGTPPRVLPTKSTEVPFPQKFTFVNYAGPHSSGRPPTPGPSSL